MKMQITTEDSKIIFTSNVLKTEKEVSAFWHFASIAPNMYKCRSINVDLDNKRVGRIIIELEDEKE